VNSLVDLQKWADTAGFFCPSVEPMNGWDRQVICTQRTKSGFGGKSLWVTTIKDIWYIGTWAGLLYRIRANGRLLEFLDVVLKDSSPHVTEINEALCEEFELNLISRNEFVSILKTCQDYKDE